MTCPAQRLFARQRGRASAPDGRVDVDALAPLVIDAYTAFDDQRRRTEHATELMAVELEEANRALERSVAGLGEQNRRFALALDNMANGLALFDRDGRLVVCNQRQEELLGIPPGAVAAGCGFDDFLRAAANLPEAGSQQRRQLAKARIEAETHQTLADGRHIRVLLRPTPDGGFLTSCEDVTEQHRTAARIAFLAYHDALTELPNRAMLGQEMAKALARGPIAVLCLDLDGFKAVNDTLGHAGGDALLVAVAARLRRVAREGFLLARLGGDEFAAVLEGDMAAARAVGARMLDAIAAPFAIEGAVVTVGTSIGVAVTPDHGDTAEQLLRRADLALYAAKAGGRNRCVAFDPAMDDRAPPRPTLEQDLRAALPAGQFEVHYQPQIRVGDGRIAGFEALLRWRHPDRGLVPPSLFIPLAERGTLIVAIGAWVLRQACRDAAGWPDAVGVSVNVSAVQLAADGLVETVAEALRTSALHPARLTLEVTETADLHDRPSLLETMVRLRALGVSLALDDFGTGYSSLSYLRRFPIDALKIDRSFVAGLGLDPKALAIVRMVSGLARTLGLPVVAEGVETREQLAILAAERCDNVQGFLYSPAVPAGRVAGLIAEANPPAPAPKPSRRFAPHPAKRLRLLDLHRER